jgi:WXG100 family type VII secretion target
MATYQVDSDVVLTTVSAVHASIERIRAEVAGLLGQLTGLQGSWSGQAAVAFQGVVGSWRATQLHVEEELTSLNHALGASAQQYAETESANARLFAH